MVENMRTRKFASFALTISVLYSPSERLAIYNNFGSWTGIRKAVERMRALKFASFALKISVFYSPPERLAIFFNNFGSWTGICKTIVNMQAQKFATFTLTISVLYPPPERLAIYNNSGFLTGICKQCSKHGSTKVRLFYTYNLCSLSAAWKAGHLKQFRFLDGDLQND